MDELKHSVIKQFEVDGEETITIPRSLIVHTLSYYEELSGEKEHRVKHFKTDSSTFLSVLMEAIAPIHKQKTQKLTLEITADGSYNPSLITHTYLTKKVTHKKR